MTNISPVFIITAGVHSSWLPGHIGKATNFYRVQLNNFESSEWNLIHVIFLSPEILKWHLGFWKMFAPLHYTYVDRHAGSNVGTWYKVARECDKMWIFFELCKCFFVTDISSHLLIFGCKMYCSFFELSV
jgi:hypothetical protein